MRDVLVDTSVWVDHFRHYNDALVELLENDLVLIHPLVIGEIACGTPPKRGETLKLLDGLRQSQQSSLHEAMNFIERENLFGTGCGLIDMMLLASTLLTPGAELWTLDKRLRSFAERFDVAHRTLMH